jgi:hypothetical protein
MECLQEYLFPAYFMGCLQDLFGNLSRHYRGRTALPIGVGDEVVDLKCLEPHKS